VSLHSCLQTAGSSTHLKTVGTVFAVANKEVVAATAEGEKRKKSPFVITVICWSN